MSKVYVVSVGLNVGTTEPAGQLGATLRAAEALFGPPLSLAMGRSEWQGQAERFVQIAVLCPSYQAERAAPLLAKALHQEAVAMIVPGAGHVWQIFTATGHYALGGEQTEFPIIAEVPTED